MNIEKLTEAQKEEIENMIEKFHLENRAKIMQVNEISYYNGDLLLGMYLTTENAQIVHRKLSLFIALVANEKRDVEWNGRRIRTGLDREIEGHNNEIFTEDDDDVIMPEKVCFIYDYKEESFRVSLFTYRYEDVTKFKITLGGTRGPGLHSKSFYTPNKEELLHYIESINTKEKYDTMQYHTKNSFVKYCKQHKLDIMINFDTILALTKNIFELYDLELVRKIYMELYNKSEEESHKYIKENEKVLTEFYGFSNYENFNKFINDLKDEIKIYITKKEDLTKVRKENEYNYYSDVQ